MMVVFRIIWQSPMAYLEWTIVILHALAASAASWHALLYKRDSRAALGWIGVCVLFPLVGPLLYSLLGVNRVENRARVLRGTGPRRRFIEFERGAEPARLQGLISAEDAGQTGLARASQAITGQTLCMGNQVKILLNGDAAYPAMLSAINHAKYRLLIMTYIFDTDAMGKAFIGALAAAANRGVDVRVMVDGLGEKYSFPRVTRLLRKAGIRVSQYNPPRLVPPTLSINLRNHRKVLLVDDGLAFTGGMNISDRHLIKNPRVNNPVADIHFGFRGPIVAQLLTVFTTAWDQQTGEDLLKTLQGGISQGPVERSITASEAGLAAWPTGGPTTAGSACRAVVDGPDENLDRLALILQAAVTGAANHIRIMTPYFLPSQALIGCLQSAALRGVKVEIILPEKSNLPYVHWATRNMLWELLYYNITVYYQPPPFVHSKLFLVDDEYSLIGSANIDPRSLRLNYELGVEIYDPIVNAALSEHFDQTINRSRPVTLDEVDGRSLAVRTRDALCWLFTPYL